MAYYRPVYWYGRGYYAYGWGGYVAPSAPKTNVQNTTNITTNAGAGSTVSVNVNQSTVVNNSVAAGGYFPYYYPRRWW